MLQRLHNGQGHKDTYKDVVEIVKNCPWCQVSKGNHVGAKTKPGSIIVSGPLDLTCVNFTKMDPSRDGKEDVLFLTDAFSKFSQAFVTSNQKAFTMAKINANKWFYVYGVPACIHSEKGQSFENEILEHLYILHGGKQSTTMPYNSHGNSTCEKFNHMLHDLLKTLDKEQKLNWPLHLLF